MKKKNIKDNKVKNILLSQKGMALLTTLIFTVILGTLAVALLTMTSNDTKLSALQRDSTDAFYQAEAGIDKALWYLNTSTDDGGKGLDWRTEGDPLEEEGYQITVDTDDTDPDSARKVIITSAGIINRGDKSVNRKIELIARRPPHIFTYKHGILANGNINFFGIISLDGDIHSNGNINKPFLSILNVSDDTMVTAHQAINQSWPYIDPDHCESGVPLQDYPESNQDLFDYCRELVDPDGTGENNINDNGRYYKGDQIFTGGTTTLTGIQFVDGDVEVSGVLNINDGALFATGDIKTITVGSNKGEININQSEGYPNSISLMAQGNIMNAGIFRIEGIIQADGNVTGIGLFTIQNGAIVGQNVTVAGGAYISYDEELQDQTVFGTKEDLYKKMSWREIY